MTDHYIQCAPICPDPGSGICVMCYQSTGGGSMAGPDVCGHCDLGVNRDGTTWQWWQMKEFKKSWEVYLAHIRKKQGTSS